MFLLPLITFGIPTKIYLDYCICPQTGKYTQFSMHKLKCLSDILLSSHHSLPKELCLTRRHKDITDQLHSPREFIMQLEQGQFEYFGNMFPRFVWAEYWQEMCSALNRKSKRAEHLDPETHRAVKYFSTWSLCMCTLRASFAQLLFIGKTIIIYCKEFFCKEIFCNFCKFPCI